MKKLLIITLGIGLIFLTSCAQIGLVVSAPPGSLAKGKLQVQMPDGKIKTMDNTNLFAKYNGKEEKIKNKYTVKVRGNKVVEIVNKSK